jgi:hypothetical protein
MATAGRSPAPNLRFADRAVGHRKTPIVLSLQLASVVAAALIPQAALAASGGVMGGRSSFSSSRSTGSSRRYSYHSSRTYVSVGTPTPPGVATDVDDEPDTVFLVMGVGVVLLFAAAMYYGRPRTTVVKLQVHPIFFSSAAVYISLSPFTLLKIHPIQWRS